MPHLTVVLDQVARQKAVFSSVFFLRKNDNLIANDDSMIKYDDLIKKNINVKRTYK